jgi:hypothetical protein
VTGRRVQDPARILVTGLLPPGEPGRAGVRLRRGVAVRKGRGGDPQPDAGGDRVLEMAAGDANAVLDRIRDLLGGDEPRSTPTRGKAARSRPGVAPNRPGPG